MDLENGWFWLQTWRCFGVSGGYISGRALIKSILRKGGWLQPIWKICASQIGSFPQRSGVNEIKYLRIYFKRFEFISSSFICWALSCFLCLCFLFRHPIEIKILKLLKLPPWKIHGWNLQIPGNDQKIWTKPPGKDMFQPFIFGVPPMELPLKEQPTYPCGKSLYNP